MFEVSLLRLFLFTYGLINTAHKYQHLLQQVNIMSAYATLIR